jgi:hypothetical protein
MTETTWAQLEDSSSLRRVVAIDAFLGEVSRQYANGGCLLYRLEALDPSLLNFAQAGGSARLLAAFLDHAAVKSALHDVKLASAKANPPPFRPLGSFELEGALTQILLGGGAYIPGMESEDDARRMSRAFVDALLGNHRRSSMAFAVEGAWTPWFYDVAWDSSYLVLDPLARAWWALFMTDTD